ncbi:PEP-CTERM sorting domain-containing protein [Duganella sp. FT135W]|uniref:PEP-CTERM sorting domain-containing protein n=1 Tax=Duganella flavida TaxID=2692175 RepID=A0A6L8KC51_9BURK|nr:PEP-CTERM sorting domain-containing protein [Duganella flavida]MYM24996.1 PEP-CTERM sorting domain-containing protein [Duganella flavida]
MKILSPLIAALLFAASMSAHADTLTYTFTGTCTKNCTHPPVTTAKDTLIITDIKAGEVFGLNNLVSFTGTGSILHPTVLGGQLPTTSGGGEFIERGVSGGGSNFYFYTFSTHVDGTWRASWISEIGAKVRYDYSGIGGTWTLTDVVTSPIPEPEQYTMLALGLAFIGMAARSRKSS